MVGNDNEFEGNDIALIRLERPAKLLITDWYQMFKSPGLESKTLAVPICLPWKRDDVGRVVFTDQGATSAGWGIQDDDDGDFNAGFARIRPLRGAVHAMDCFLVPFFIFGNSSTIMSLPEISSAILS